MEVDYSLLKTIHRLLRQRTDLGERIERGPRKITIAENAEKNFEEAVATSKETRTKTQMAADEKQLQLGEREAKIENLKAKLNTAGSNREFQLLKDQIAADEQANLVLSDEILELLERVDTIEAEYKTAQENLAKAQQETQKVRDTVGKELESLQADLDSVVKDLAEQDDQLRGDYAIEYKRMAAVKGEEALAETDMQTCGQCYTKITTQKMSDLMMKKPVFCESCGTLMYTMRTTVPE